jgi:hypothetical protein
MIIVIKIFIVLVLIVFLYFACFKSVLEIKKSIKLILIAGFVPYLFITVFLFNFLVKLLFHEDNTLEEVTQKYTLLFWMPYLLFIVRIVFITIFSRLLNFAIKRSASAVKNYPKALRSINYEKIEMQKNVKYFFVCVSFFYFIAGCFIVISIVFMKDIYKDTNESNDNNSPYVLEKWIFVSEDAKELNDASNNLFILSQDVYSDTITYLFYSDNVTGFIINKTDSLPINYSYNIDELQIEHNKKLWTLPIVSKADHEMIVSLPDSTQKKLIKGEF